MLAICDAQVNKTLVTIKIPTEDDRARNFFLNGPGQLSPANPGIIFINVTNIPTAMKQWPKLLKEEFNSLPELNKIISGFIVHDSPQIVGPSGVTEVIRTNTIVNTNANHKIPEWILNKLKLTEIT